MTTALGLAAQGGYASINDEQIQELAGLVAASDRVTGTAGETYMRVLVTRIKAYMCAALSSETVLTALDKAEAPMYDAVKKGSLTIDIVYNPLVDKPEVRAAKAKEHNRRCNWARSIKSELKGALSKGVSLDSIDPSTVTKNKLRDMKTAAIEATVGMPARATTNADQACHAIAKACGLVRLARVDGDDLSTVGHLISVLVKIHDGTTA